MQVPLEEGRVERVCGDAAGAEAVGQGPEEAQPSHGFALQAAAVLLHDALGYLFEEAAGVAGVVRARGGIGSGVAAVEEGASGVVVELVDAAMAVAVPRRVGRRH